MATDLSESLIIRKSICRDTMPSHSFNVSIKKPVEQDGYYKMNPNLSADDIVTIVKSQLTKNYKDILKGLKTFDLEGTGIVTKGELRRVLDLYSIPMTTQQYEALLSLIPINSSNGSVNYTELLEKVKGSTDSLNLSNDQNNKLPQLQRSNTTMSIHNDPNRFLTAPRRSFENSQRSQLSSSCSSRSTTSRSSSRKWNYNTYSIDEIIPIIQMQITQNPKGIMKAFQLFDFNSDHIIHRGRLKKVLENFCCPLSDQQFDKLLSRFSHSETGSVNYLDFMNSIGIPINAQGTLQTNKCPNKDVSIDTRISDDKRIIKLALTDHGYLRNSELEDLLIIFRKKIEDQFYTLRKAFFVMDPHAEGFVKLDVLHNILNQFVFPMSENVFKQLMEKCAFKATGKVAWLSFLQKFQDPQSKHLNGSTITIKSDHKCNPIQGTNFKGHVDELLELLCKHVNNNYNSFRDAFLQINKTHKGKIPKAEFIKILNRFQFQISPEQINLIFNFLDPNKRGFISYHHFLQLFEQKENLSAHKWLNSNHKVIEPKKDLKMSSETLKSTLTDNIINKWPNVVREFKSFDHSGKGFISIINLKTVFAKLFGYLSEDDIDRLIVPLTMRDKNGCISYFELFNLLGIDTAPTDLDGLSTQIINANNIHNKERHEEHVEKMNSIGKIIEARVNSMRSEEIVARVKDRILQNRTNSYEIYKKYECPDKKGGVNKEQLKKMLIEFGFILTVDQLEKLFQDLNFPNDLQTRLDFNGFMTNVLDNRECYNDLNTSECFLPLSNHHVNDIRGEDGRNMNSLEVEELLREKIVNKFPNLISAFHKFDTNGKGYLTKSDFRNFLRASLIVIEDDQFDLLCQNLGMGEKCKLTYTDFLERFQIRDDMVGGHKWLVSNHKFNELANNVLPEITAEDAFKLLPDKIYQCFSNLTPTFLHLVTNGTGFIRFKNLKQLLTKVQINMTKEESRKLWKMYDIHNRNKLDYHDFLYNMGLLEKFNVGDTGGPSATIIQNSHKTLVNLLTDQESKHQKGVDNQALFGSHLQIENIFEMIKRHLRETYADTKTAFKAITNKKSLSAMFKIRDLNRLLSHIHLFVTNEKFMQLAARIGFAGPDDCLSYEQFSKIFQEKIIIGGQEKCVEHLVHNQEQDKPSTIVVEEAGHLNNDEITVLISKKINNEYSEIEKTFFVLDSENSGVVTINEFRNLLNGFCLSLTDNQFKNYMNSLSGYIIKDDNGLEKFDYRYFMKNFNQKAKEQVNKSFDKSLLQPSSVNSTKLTFQNIHEYINESIKARPQLFLKAFKSKDYAGLRFISKNDFKDVLEQYIFKIHNQDFERFWSLQSKNEFENIDYVAFIKGVAGYSDADQENILKSSVSKNCGTVDLIETNEEDYLEITRMNLEKLLNKHWQSIFSKCKTIDQEASETRTAEGTILFDDFINILSDYDNTLSAEKLTALNLYKTCRNGRVIRYGDLIRSIVLSSRGSLISHENVVDVKTKFANVGIKTTNSDNTKDYFSQLFKLRRQILENWKALRKHFLDSDKKQNGTVSGNIFMATMKSVCGQLSADLFYHLMKLYDYEGSGDFHYKKFIEDFLKTA